MSDEPLWRFILVTALLLFFVTQGVRMVLDPDRFVRRSGIPKGGELLRTWNRGQMRLAGAVFAAAAIYVMYRLFVA